MAGSGTVDLVSDGCSGFQWAEGLFPAVRQCCVEHDFGGSNGTLLDCLESVLPLWAYPIAAVFVALMIIVRPLYRKLKRRQG
jgi:hypothetical protein